MEFRLLGPLEVVDGDRSVPLGGAKQRALLAVLLLRAGEVVSTDRLIDDVWGEHRPPTGAKVVQVYVSGLRKALERDGAREVILTRPPGYCVQVAPGELDAQRFERLLGVGSAALGAGKPEAAENTLCEALGLWRGPALADFLYEPFAQSAIGRLDELRLVALEQRIEAGLAIGRHASLIGEIEALVAEHPLREGLRGQLMLALYRAGRQAEALDVYQQARRTLVEELGIDPSPSLQELEKAILRHDSGLDLQRPADGAPAASSAPAPKRALLVVASSAEALAGLIALTELLSRARPGHELLVTRLVAPSARGSEDLAEATTALRGLRDELADRGAVARVATFTSADRASDVVRLAKGQQVELLVLDADRLELGNLAGTELGTVLDDVPCDVAITVFAGAERAPPGPDRPVLVPFGAAAHDWAALELGAWLALSHDAPLRLLGADSGREQGSRDASRMLADASLVVQRVAGLVPEPVLAAPGPDGISEAARGAGLLVLGLSERWREDGLGHTRGLIAERSPVPVVFVRRGVRPGALALPEELTRYSWSFAASPRAR